MTEYLILIGVTPDYGHILDQNFLILMEVINI